MSEELFELRLTVNGRDVRDAVPGEMTLLDFLRERLDLASVKTGCRIGYCGACTVVLEGMAVHSCCLLAAQADGLDVETVEGASDEVATLQGAFARQNAVQCGVCIPGMIMSGVPLLRSRADPGPPDERALLDALLGNICRCGGYSRIMAALREAQVDGPT